MKKLTKSVKASNKVTMDQMSTLPENKRVEAMREHYKKHPSKIGSQAPVSSQLVDLEVLPLLKLMLPQYQRDYQHSRTEFLVQSIIRFGDMGSSVITVIVDKDGNIIGSHDGRHRLVAKYILDEKTITANIVQFKSEKDEIDYFNMINVPMRPMTPEQRLFNQYEAGWPIAELIYDLGFTDSDSNWNGKVSLRGTPRNRGQMSLPNFNKVLNWGGFGLRRRMEGESDLRAMRKYQNMTYKEVLDGVNGFHDWYYKLAQFPHPIKDKFVKDKVLISLLEFYYCAQRQNSSLAVMQPERILQTALNKFRMFNLESLQGLDPSKAPDELFKAFNGSGEKERVHKVLRLRHPNSKE